jgi:hypothetical protein
MEGTCFICYYRIREDQASIVCKVGDRYRSVHRHHADERKIKIHSYPYNLVDEILVEEAEIL